MRRRIERLAARWRQVRGALPSALRRIFGFPDYTAYLEHCRRAGHAPQLGEREFLDEHFTARGKATRCC